MPYKDPAKRRAYQVLRNRRKRKERLEKEKIFVEALYYLFLWSTPDSFYEVYELAARALGPLTTIQRERLERLWRKHGKHLLTALAVTWKEAGWQRVTFGKLERILETVVLAEEVCPTCGRPYPKGGEP